MKLDSRIIEGKKPLTVFDIDLALTFEGQEGYFSDYPAHFTNLDRTTQGCLTKVDKTSDYDEYPYFCEQYYKFFLPAEWVNTEEPEKEWRPYLIDEWLQEHNFGDMIEFRHKSIKREFTMMFTGQIREIDGTMRIILGAHAYDFDELFEYYELIDKTNNGKFAWRPFGIEVK